MNKTITLNDIKSICDDLLAHPFDYSTSEQHDKAVYMQQLISKLKPLDKDRARTIINNTFDYLDELPTSAEYKMEHTPSRIAPLTRPKTSEGPSNEQHRSLGARKQFQRVQNKVTTSKIQTKKQETYQSKTSQANPMGATAKQLHPSDKLNRVLDKKIHDHFTSLTSKKNRLTEDEQLTNLVGLIVAISAQHKIDQTKLFELVNGTSTCANAEEKVQKDRSLVETAHRIKRQQSLAHGCDKTNIQQAEFCNSSEQVMFGMRRKLQWHAPAEFDGVVSFESSDESVVIINHSGYIVTTGHGKATVSMFVNGLETNTLVIESK
ncbi:MAG: hypothetical protein LBM27_05660 [Lactobacillaceae bacterium]|jgi:hypothetical protein|nr:hypothetical protein [Lactobacillaceae bacterium]